MSDEDGEYEVESVQEARVGKAKGKNGKPFWEFRVRWKGYSPDDDTWEPLSSFDDSPDIIDTFWARCKDSRPLRDLKRFTVGEKFLPRGPPPRKPKKKIAPAAGTSSLQDAASPPRANVPSPPIENEGPTLLDISHIPTGKRRRGLIDVAIPEKPSKRLRESVSAVSRAQKTPRKTDPKPKAESLSARLQGSSRRKPPREPSPEIIPDSDEEVEAMKLGDLDSEASRSLPDVVLDHGPAPPSPPASASPARKSPRESPIDEDLDISTPSRQLRTRKSLVKIVNEPAATKQGGKPPARTRAAASKRSDQPVASSSSQGQSTSSTQTRQRPGPGRSSFGFAKKSVSSLLTGVKGSLKSIKGSYHPPAEQVPAPLPERPVTPPTESVAPEDPPTADELLNLAGFDAHAAGELPNFEDHEPETVPAATEPDGDPAQDAQTSALAQERAESLNKAKESLFPMSAMSVDQPIPWNRPTIFGPLTAGKQSMPSLPLEADPDQPNHSPFFLNLDATTTVPILFTDVVPTGSRLAPDTQVAYKSPPGGFYTQEASGALLDAVRSLGVAGRVLVRSDAPADLKKHFLHFSQRLQNGDLFIAPAGIQLYAFCSSDSNLLCSRMNISPGLQVAEGQVLVCKIVVDNFSGYAEVAGKADSRQWAQYVGSLA